MSRAFEDELGELDLAAGRGERGVLGSSEEIKVEAWSGLRTGASLNCVERASVDTLLPHEEQNRASGGTCVPQELQRDMGADASTRKCLAAVYVNVAEMGIAV